MSISSYGNLNFTWNEDGAFCNRGLYNFNNQGLVFTTDSDELIHRGVFPNLSYSTDWNLYLMMPQNLENRICFTDGETIEELVTLNRNAVVPYDVERTQSFVTRGASDDEFAEYYILMTHNTQGETFWYAAGMINRANSEWVLERLKPDLNEPSNVVWYGADTGQYGAPLAFGDDRRHIVVSELSFDFKRNTVSFSREGRVQLARGNRRNITSGLFTTFVAEDHSIQANILYNRSPRHRRTFWYTFRVEDQPGSDLVLRLTRVRTRLYKKNQTYDATGCLPNTALPTTTTTTTTTAGLITEYGDLNFNWDVDGEFCNRGLINFNNEGLVWTGNRREIIHRGIFPNLAYSTAWNLYVMMPQNLENRICFSDGETIAEIVTLNRDAVVPYDVGRTQSFVTRGASDDEFAEYYILMTHNLDGKTFWYAAGMINRVHSEWVLERLTPDTSEPKGVVWYGADTGRFGAPLAFGDDIHNVIVSELSFDFKNKTVSFSREGRVPLSRHNRKNITSGLFTTFVDEDHSIQANILYNRSPRQRRTFWYTFKVQDMPGSDLQLSLTRVRTRLYNKNETFDATGCLPNTALPIPMPMVD